MQLDPSCSTELLPRVAKYQLSFTAAPAQAMCGILFLFPTMGKGPLVKKFKGNNLLYIHFKLWFILSLPCKNNLVSPFEKKWCNCSKPKRLLVHPRESFPLPEGSAGGMCSLTADHQPGGSSSVLWMLFGCERGELQFWPQTKLLHFLNIVCMQDPFDPSFTEEAYATWIEHFLK